MNTITRSSLPRRALAFAMSILIQTSAVIAGGEASSALRLLEVTSASRAEVTALAAAAIASTAGQDGRQLISQAAPAAPRVFRVRATAEGLIGGRTASGLIIRPYTEGVALPHRSALGQKTSLVYLANGRQTSARVVDVGPWNIDDAYWKTAAGRPQAESGRDRSGRRTNRAGIDILNGSWYKLLGLRAYDRHLIENTTGTVDWCFVD